MLALLPSLWNKKYNNDTYDEQMFRKCRRLSLVSSQLVNGALLAIIRLTLLIVFSLVRLIFLQLSLRWTERVWRRSMCCRHRLLLLQLL